MLDNIVLFIGISGVIAIAFNFILEATDHLKKDHHIFAILNLYGSSALLFYSWYNLVWLFVILNGFLVTVGIYGLNKVYKNKI
jgi:hypothetical protein